MSTLPLLPLLPLLLPLLPVSIPCPVHEVDAPLVHQDGDYLIGAIFNIGSFHNTTSDNTTYPDGYCSQDVNTSVHFHAVQKAIVFRIAMEEERIKMREQNISLGYVIYMNCDSDRVTARIANKLGTAPKVVAVLGIDHGDFSVIFSRQTTAYYLPTITYIYNDETLMNSENFPTMVSLIHTKKQEGEAISRFLEKMDYHYVDVWYHELSSNIAQYLMNDYLGGNEHGCGIMSTFEPISTTPDDRAADVQLLLGNSITSVKSWLNETIESGEQNKIYITGTSNGRLKNHKMYQDVLGNVTGSDDTIVFPLSLLLNTEMKQLSARVAAPWVENTDQLDKLYRSSQEAYSHCAKECPTSSWLVHVVTGTHVLARALQDTLLQFPESNTDCAAATLLRRRIYEKILEPGREIEVELEEDVKVKVAFTNQTIRFEMTLGVYQSRTNQYRVLGTVSPHSIHVTNETLLEEISHYKTRCSPDCKPGSYRAYKNAAQVSRLPCCWQCISCPPDQVSNITNQNTCHICDRFATNNTNQTECHPVKIVYIKQGILIGGAVLAVVGAVLVILTTILVWKNEGRPIVKASEPGYLYTLLAAIFLLFIISMVPLFRPSQATCSLEFVIVVLASTLITTNLLWKCIKIHAIFAAANSFQRPKFEILLKQAGQVGLNTTSLLFTVLLLLIDGFGTGPGWKFSDYQEIYHAPIYPQCGMGTRSEGIGTLLPIILPTTCFLATLIFVFKMRHFPHNFRETLNILGATLIVSFCCIMFLSGYSVSPPETRALLRAIVIYITSLAFLLCLFLPKAIVLLKKNADTDEEKRIIMESLKAFADRTAKMQLETRSPRSSRAPSPVRSLRSSIAHSPVLTAPRSTISTSPNATPSTVRSGRWHSISVMGQAGGRCVQPKPTPANHNPAKKISSSGRKKLGVLKDKVFSQVKMNVLMPKIVVTEDNVSTGDTEISKVDNEEDKIVRYSVDNDSKTEEEGLNILNKEETN